jgi:6-phosphogluconolactonase (cycloisomerase 2 family)
MKSISKHITLLVIGTMAAFTLAAQPLRILVGTYTEHSKAEGVYLYSIDPEKGENQLLSVAPSGNPSFVIASPDGKMAYSVNEYKNGKQGVSSYSIEGDVITLLDNITIPKERANGEDPCNLLYTGGAIVSSNYTGGSITAFGLQEDGRIRGVTQVFQPSIEGHPAHMHCATASPDGKYIFVTDLGNDFIYRFERGQGGAPIGNGDIAWTYNGSIKYGPRHLIFSADGRFAYLLCELGDHLVVFEYGEDGKLTQIQNILAYKGDGRSSADLHLSPDGRFLYTSHRFRKEGISIFSVDQATGQVTPVGFRKTGRHPRNFAITPDGAYLLCACRDSNCIEVYRINPKTGALATTKQKISVPSPVCIQFLP